MAEQVDPVPWDSVPPVAPLHAARVPEHIVVPLPRAPSIAPLGQLAPLTIQRLESFRRLWRAQDTQPGQARRVLAEYSLSGAQQWAVPEGTVDPESGANTYPLDTVWREVGAYRGRLTAGCMLEAHLMYCPAGLVQRAAGLSYQSAGAWAELRVGVTWTNGAETTGPHYRTAFMAGSTFGPYGGRENTGAGEDWESLRERMLEAIRPPGSDSDLDLAADYSEWSDVEITIEVRGGERVVHATVSETPDRHVHRHDDDGPQTVHGAPAADVPFPGSARESAPEVSVYENHRLGTVRTMQTAQRQGERLGPHVLAWSSSRHLNDFSSARYLLVSTVANFVDVFDPSFEGWDAQYPGWVVACSTAQLHRLHGRSMNDRAAVVPVTVWLDASPGDTSGTTTTVRLQSGEYEWIDIEVDNSQARQTVKAYGYLESQVHGDHAAANVVVQAQVEGFDLRLYGLSVAFGHW